MRNVTYFYFDGCPYCAQADAWLASLVAERPEYAGVAITRIDERKRPDIANKFDYYYVPTFYVDGVKVHEGAASREKIEAVLRGALEEPAQVV